MSLDNCRRCTRLFQRDNSAYCVTCQEFMQKQRMDMYQFIQANPGVSIEEISERFGIHVKEVEAMIFNGSFGTANQLIRSHCSRCKCQMTVINRVGYFCYSCNKAVGKEGKAAKRAAAEAKAAQEEQHQVVSVAAHPDEAGPTVEETSPTILMVPKKKATPKRTPTEDGESVTFGFKRISSD